MTITCTSPTTFHIPDEEIVSLLVKAGLIVTGQRIEPDQTLSREEYAKQHDMHPDTVTRRCKLDPSNPLYIKHKRIGRRIMPYVNVESKQQSIQSNLKKVG